MPPVAAGLLALTRLLETATAWRPVLASPSTQSAGIAAGDAEFRRIVAGGVREWEGDVHGRAAWALESYGAFLKQFPQHPRAGEALFGVAEATWARGGYPELFHYIFTPGGWADWNARAQYLEQWFDTRGFAEVSGWSR